LIEARKPEATELEICRGGRDKTGSRIFETSRSTGRMLKKPRIRNYHKGKNTKLENGTGADSGLKRGNQATLAKLVK